MRLNCMLFGCINKTSLIKAVFFLSIGQPKHGFRSGIRTISWMSATEQTGGGEQTPLHNHQLEQLQKSHTIWLWEIPTLPYSLKALQPLKTAGKLTTNWKRFKWTLDNYAIVARLEHFDGQFKMVMFFSAIGEDLLEMFKGMDFTHRNRLSSTPQSSEKVRRILHQGNKWNLR